MSGLAQDQITEADVAGGGQRALQGFGVVEEVGQFVDGEGEEFGQGHSVQANLPCFGQIAGAATDFAFAADAGEEAHVCGNRAASLAGGAVAAELFFVQTEGAGIVAVGIQGAQGFGQTEEIGGRVNAGARLVDDDGAIGSVFDGIIRARLDRLVRDRGGLFFRG